MTSDACTPARSAMDLMVAPSKPWRANSSCAAWRIRCAVSARLASRVVPPMRSLYKRLANVLASSLNACIARSEGTGHDGHRHRRTLDHAEADGGAQGATREEPGSQ